MSLLINIEDLLSGSIVEGTRMEFKKGWNPTTIMRSVCAFANDFENEGSGYIILGVEEADGIPIRPVFGFNPRELEKVEKELIRLCNLIKPSYFPRLSLEEVDGKHVLVIWTPAGSNRPYKVPDDVSAKHKTYNYRIRYRSNSIIPNEEQERDLIELTAKIPFDDRVHTHVSVNELSMQLMREHLEKTKSKLIEENTGITKVELAEKMNLTQGADEHLFPKNVGLLMFTENPQQFFKGAYIDIVEFPKGVAGKEFSDKSFVGPIQKQLVDVLDYLKRNVVKSKTIKNAYKEEVDKLYNYPYAAIEEALSNAVYHRNYELQDPIEVRVLPESIEIISYNGVDPSLRQSDFDRGIVRARRYRNRRVGEFLKELRLTEGRGTGIPTIVKTLLENGSPEPIFDTNDPERTHFVIEILIHSAFTDQDTDQDADQDENALDPFVVREAQHAYGLFESKEFISTDQDTDQDDHAFISESKKLLDHLERIVGTGKPSAKLVEKYTESSLSISEEQFQILTYTKTPKSNKEIQESALGLKTHTDNFKNHIEPLLNKGFIRRTIPSKPTSKHQQYYTTDRGTIVIDIRKKIINH